MFDALLFTPEECDLCGRTVDELTEFNGLFYCSSPICTSALERHRAEYIFGSSTVRETD